jgi:hypothetical protein
MTVVVLRMRTETIEAGRAFYKTHEAGVGDYFAFLCDLALLTRVGAEAFSAFFAHGARPILSRQGRVDASRFPPRKTKSTPVNSKLRFNRYKDAFEAFTINFDLPANRFKTSAKRLSDGSCKPLATLKKRSTRSISKNS